MLRSGASLIATALAARSSVANQMRRQVSPRLRRTLVQVSATKTQPSHKLTSERETEATVQNDSTNNFSVDSYTGKSRVGSNWNYNIELMAFAERLGYKLKELPSLRSALRDNNLLGSVPAKAGSQGVEVSRLSVFGRATMMYYVTEYLHFAYPNLEGSQLIDVCTFLTNDNALIDLAKYIGLSALIQTKRPLSDPKNTFVITNTFCAVIGALCRDKGGKSARTFIHSFIIAQLAGKDLHDLIKLQHPRFMLYAILKSQGLPKPESRLLRETGRATHFPSFVVGVYSGETLLGEGCGTSLKRAEWEAMVAALQKRFQKELSQSPLPSDHDDYCREEELVALQSSLTEKHSS